MWAEIIQLVMAFAIGFVVGVVYFWIHWGSASGDERVVVVAPGSEFEMRATPQLYKCEYCDGRLAFVSREALHEHVLEKHSTEILKQGDTDSG